MTTYKPHGKHTKKASATDTHTKERKESKHNIMIVSKSQRRRTEEPGVSTAGGFFTVTRPPGKAYNGGHVIITYIV